MDSDLIGWLFRSFFVACLTTFGFLLKWIFNRTVASVDGLTKWKDEFLKEMTHKGGIVTRDDHFIFCGQTREKCPIASISEWKQELYEKGGFLMKAEHTALCKEVTEHASQLFVTEIAHHRELMEKELKLLQATIANEITQGISSLQREIIKQLKSNGSKQ